MSFLGDIPALWTNERGSLRALASESAREALEYAAKEDPGEPGLYGREGRDALSRAVVSSLRKLAAALDGPSPVERFARYLEGRAPRGAQLAKRTRLDGATLTAETALRRLAYVLWCESIRAQVQKDVVRNHPGFPLPLVDSARYGTWGAARVEGLPPHGPLLVDRHGTMLATRDPDRVPSMPMGLLDRMEAWSQEGAHLLGSVLVYRLLLWLAWEIHAKSIPGHAPVLEVTGGWAGLMRVAGGHSNLDADRLRAIVCCLDTHRFAFPDGSAGRLLTLHYQEDRGPKHPAIIRLTPGAPLLPNYIFRLPPPDRKVVPVLRELPPMVGRERDHGALAELHWRLLVEMRRRCSEMVCAEGEDLGILLDGDGWRDLADQARVPSKTLNLALERWTHDADDGPAFLRVISPDRFTLGPAHEEARRVLLHYGGREAQGREAGRKSARARSIRLVQNRKGASR